MTERSKGGIPAGMSIWLNPGNASSQVLYNLYTAMSNLFRAYGGVGLSFRDDETRIVRSERATMAKHSKPYFVVVKPIPSAGMRKGGALEPRGAEEATLVGEIVAVGPGKITDEGKKIAPEVKVGDKILYGKYSGIEVTVEGEEYLIMREADLFSLV